MKHILRTLLGSFVLATTCGTASAQYIYHIAGKMGVGHTGDSAYARFAGFRCPIDVCKDQSDNLYIADGGPFAYENDACIRKVDAATGYIYTIAGLIDSAETPANMADSIPSVNAKLKGIAAICIDKEGDLLIADGYSAIRKIDLSTGKIFTIAGTVGVKGYSGDNDSAYKALFDAPFDIAVDNSNNIYVADLGNNVVRRINAVNSVVTTIAGRPSTFGLSGDGGLAINAKLDQPRGVYADGSGNVYIADYNNHRIRRVSNTGIISTVAGSSIGFGGDGDLAVNAKLNQPARITMDASGDMYISDAANQRIRKVSASAGIISTYAGNGEHFTGSDMTGDGGLATAAAIAPYGLALDKCGNLYMGSVVNNIRVVTINKFKGWELCDFTTGTQNAGIVATSELLVYPNPNPGAFSVNILTNTSYPLTISITDVTGREVTKVNTTTNSKTDVNLNVKPGLYFVQATVNGERYTKKVFIQ